MFHINTYNRSRERNQYKHAWCPTCAGPLSPHASYSTSCAASARFSLPLHLRCLRSSLALAQVKRRTGTDGRPPSPLHPLSAAHQLWATPSASPTMGYAGRVNLCGRPGVSADLVPKEVTLLLSTLMIRFINYLIYMHIHFFIFSLH